MKPKFFAVFLAAVVIAMLGCAVANLVAKKPPAVTPTATKTPKPTYTPTAVPTNTPIPPTPTDTPVPPTNTPVVPPTDTPLPTPTPLPPTPTPEPQPVAVVNGTANLRGGPGTNYAIIGKASQGQQFEIIGRNPAGDWVQICCVGNGPAWIAVSLVQIQGRDLAAIPVATNIPPPPPPTPTPIPPPPTNTPLPPPPTNTPAPQYTYNKGLLQRCEPNAGVTYAQGTVYYNHQPQNGVKVVWSYAPDGPWVTDPVISGPHPGYTNWNPGFWSHIIGASGPRGGDWYFWLVDDSGKRISVIVHLHTDDSAGSGKCQQAIIDFDTN